MSPVSGVFPGAAKHAEAGDLAAPFRKRQWGLTPGGHVPEARVHEESTGSHAAV